MGAATITSKGQITIPADIRTEFGLQAGDRLVFFQSLTGDLRVHISRRRVGAGRGSIPGKGADLSRNAIGSAVGEGVRHRLERAAQQRKLKDSAA